MHCYFHAGLLFTQGGILLTRTMQNNHHEEAILRAGSATSGRSIYLHLYTGMQQETMETVITTEHTNVASLANRVSFTARTQLKFQSRHSSAGFTEIHLQQ